MLKTKGEYRGPDELLRRSEERFLKMIEEIQDYIVLILDKDGFIKNWNIGAAKLQGYEASEIIGKNFRIFYRPEDLKNKLPERLLNEAIETGRAGHEGWHVRKDGTLFWASVMLTALHNDAKEVDGFLKITKDLTAQKNADDKLKHYVEELAHKNEQLRKSEELYHQMIDEVEDYAIILLDKEGKILHWNKGAQRIKGYKPSEAIGKSFSILYTKEDNDAGLPYKLLGEARDQGRVSHEGWRVKKSGEKFWGTVVITALHNQAGEIIGFSKVTRDLTQRKRAEDELRVFAKSLEQKTQDLQLSEERHHRMIEEVQDYAIILLDKDGTILNWNKGAESIKGYAAKEIIGRSFTVFYPEKDKQSGLPQQLLNEAVKNNRSAHEGWRLRKDGSRFWGSTVITALHNNHNELIGFSKVTRDLTERKYAEETLREYTEKLEHNNQELEQFAYVASHDLKEPLRKIITFGNLLENSGKDLLDEKSKDYVTRMQNAAARMMNLIEDLLVFSRVSRPTEGFELVDLNAVLNRVLSDLEVAINSRNAKVDVRELPAVHGRKSQLSQLFQNLISNAVKFNDKEQPIITIRGTITGATGRTGRLVQIDISDNGIGFENIYNTRIFEIFQRLHGKTEYPGTGIGLAICKKIVEAHGGTISATGEPGKGAIFTIKFPFPP